MVNGKIKIIPYSEVTAEWAKHHISFSQSDVVKKRVLHKCLDNIKRAVYEGETSTTVIFDVKVNALEFIETELKNRGFTLTSHIDAYIEVITIAW